jgi:hypothetical protein
MKLFFNDLDSLHQYTLELDTHQDTLQCHACSAIGQFVSHGLVYKNDLELKKDVVGKRIFCSNRHCRSGCGRTRRLYLSWVIPACRYVAMQLTLFLIALIAGSSIVRAYQQATGTHEARHGYRWLIKLQQQLIPYRTFIKNRATDILSRFNTRVRRLQILLPTVVQLFAMLDTQPCTDYQIKQQRRFF